MIESIVKCDVCKRVIEHPMKEHYFVLRVQRRLSVDEMVDRVLKHVNMDGINVDLCAECFSALKVVVDEKTT